MHLLEEPAETPDTEDSGVKEQKQAPTGMTLRKSSRRFTQNPEASDAMESMLAAPTAKEEPSQGAKDIKEEPKKGMVGDGGWGEIPRGGEPPCVL